MRVPMSIARLSVCSAVLVAGCNRTPPRSASEAAAPTPPSASAQLTPASAPVRHAALPECPLREKAELTYEHGALREGEWSWPAKDGDARRRSVPEALSGCGDLDQRQYVINLPDRTNPALTAWVVTALPVTRPQQAWLVVDGMPLPFRHQLDDKPAGSTWVYINAEVRQFQATLLRAREGEESVSVDLRDELADLDAVARWVEETCLAPNCLGAIVRLDGNHRHAHSERGGTQLVKVALRALSASRPGFVPALVVRYRAS